MDYVTTSQGERRRVHREYVDVVARFGRDGSIDPVCVVWRDGRSFPIDEVLEAGSFGTLIHGKPNRAVSRVPWPPRNGSLP